MNRFRWSNIALYCIEPEIFLANIDSLHNSQVMSSLKPLLTMVSSKINGCLNYNVAKNKTCYTIKRQK